METGCWDLEQFAQSDGTAESGQVSLAGKHGRVMTLELQVLAGRKSRLDDVPVLGPSGAVSQQPLEVLLGRGRILVSSRWGRRSRAG
jgi:hypothetical protein